MLKKYNLVRNGFNDSVIRLPQAFLIVDEIPMKEKPKLGIKRVAKHMKSLSITEGIPKSVD